jgi:PadR family transcriptional regulator, regulatory protein PadR
MREMKKGSLGLLLLNQLQRGPNYGYAICEQLREQSGGILNFEEGAIYPVLHAYERQGLIESFWEESSEIDGTHRGPRRKYYRITSLGSDALRAAIQEWQTFTGAMEQVLEQPEQKFLSWLVESVVSSIAGSEA